MDKFLIYVLEKEYLELNNLRNYHIEKILFHKNKTFIEIMLKY